MTKNNLSYGRGEEGEGVGGGGGQERGGVREGRGVKIGDHHTYNGYFVELFPYP